ncbi:GerMN domain-containing protein [Citricoccus nitrophenolicus]|uniref:Sporulation and spore germination protein n=1 Tax=Citricoccus muralis TaxID=169134 RepID=A0A3D9LGV5_9MICC|nr:GerMN domain-containing protein [Citricoccus muralis]REE04896.1 sporulation and spore germination protein [Citricoccus muralis]
MTSRRRPDHASGHPALRRTAAGLTAALATVVLAGCSIFPFPNEAPTDQDGTALPEANASGYAELPLYFVALSGDFPPATTGRDVACQDLLVRASSVPVKTEDRVGSAVGFLIDDEQYSHGDPAITNSVDPSEDGLLYSSSRVEGDTVTVELTGDVVTRSQCESFRIRAQLNRTAAAAAGVENAEILVDGVRLEEILGLPELELGEEFTTPADEPAPGEGTDSTEGAAPEGGTGETDELDEIGDPNQLNGNQG